MSLGTMEQELQRLLAHIDQIAPPRVLDVTKETVDERLARIDRRRFLAQPEMHTGWPEFPKE